MGGDRNRGGKNPKANAAQRLARLSSLCARVVFLASFSLAIRVEAFRKVCSALPDRERERERESSGGDGGGGGGGDHRDDGQRVLRREGGDPQLDQCHPPALPRQGRGGKGPPISFLPPHSIWFLG